MGKFLQVLGSASDGLARIVVGVDVGVNQVLRVSTKCCCGYAEI